MKNKIFLAALCVAAVSCAQMGKYKEVTEVPETAYGNLELSEASANMANLKWQEVFTDDKLQRLIDTALVYNQDYRASAEHIAQAEAALLGAKLEYIPSLGINPTLNTTFSGKGLSISSYDFKVAAGSSWQLSIFRLINNQKGAEADLARVEDCNKAVRSKLIASIADTYYTLLMLDAQVETSTNLEAAWQKSMETVVALKQEGMADQVAVSQYQATLDNIRITLTSLKAQLKQAENVMFLLLGTAPVKDGIARGQLEDQNLPNNLYPGVPAQMLALRPDVRAAQRSMEVAWYAQRGALLNFFPALSINGSVGLVNTSTGAISPMSLLANVGAGLTAPILNFGRNRSAYLAAQSAMRESRLNFDKTLLTAGKEVNDAFIDFFSYEEQQKYHESRVSALNKAREDTEYLMRNSLDKTYLDVLYAYTNYFDAKLAIIANQARKMQSVVAIYSSLGGGAE